MLTPAYKLTLGGQVVDSAGEPRASTVVELGVSLDLDTPADRFTVMLGRVGIPAPAREDAAVIELGYASGGGLTQVMTGTVVTLEPGLVRIRVAGHSAAEALLHTFADETFESKKAGEIVRELAGRAGVGVARAEDGIEFPAYVVDGRRSLYHHVRELSRLCGFELYVDAAGELVFERFTGGTVHVFEYARHLLELEGLAAPPPAATIEAWGESPGGSDESWAWLTKDFSGAKGSAGTGDPVLVLERPALRTAAAAAIAAEAARTAIARRALRGRLKGVGRPEVKLGDSIRLSGAPEATLDGLFQVRSVNHHLDKQAGFTTTVGFRSID